MTNLAHNHGLEMPTFDATTAVAWTSADIVNIARSGADRMIRRIYLGKDCIRASSNLKSALWLADQVLQQTGEHFDAQVIDHVWGLYRGRFPGPRDCHYDSDLSGIGMDGYSLVAEVEVVKGAEVLSGDQMRAFADKKYSYDDAALEPGKVPYTLYDMRPSHFVADDPGATLATHLVDIEPMLEKV